MIPDLAQLPVAAGQAPDLAAYDALNLGAMAAGGQYNDPTTSVLVTKVTDSTTPAGTGNRYHSYSNGPQEISLPWGDDGDKYTLAIWANDSPYFVDYQLGGTLSNYRACPYYSDTGGTFGTDPANPRIFYYLSGDSLNRYDTATDSLANTGYFPKSGMGDNWLQVDRDNDWFVSKEDTGPVVCMWQSSTDTYQTESVGLDEPYLDKDGEYVFCNRDQTNNRYITLATNTDNDYTTALKAYHAASPSGYIVHGGNDDGYVVKIDYSGTQTNVVDLGPGTYGYHASGNWIQEEGIGTAQYILWSDDGTYGGDIRNGMALVKLDGTNVRLFAHQYGDRLDNNSYFNVPHPTISQDGLLVMWTGDMNNPGASADPDVFIAELPRQEDTVAFRAGPSTARAYEDAKKVSGKAKIRAAALSTEYQSTAARQGVIRTRNEFANFAVALNAAKAVPGMAQYARDQEDDQAYDVVAEFNAMIAAIDAVVAEIETVFPTGTGDFLLVTKFGAGATMEQGTFTPGQLATLRGLLDDVDAAVTLT